MDFDLSDEQRMLHESLEKLMTGQYGFDMRQGFLKEEGDWSRAVDAKRVEKFMAAHCKLRG